MQKTKVLLIVFLLFFATVCNRGNEQQGDELMSDDLLAADLSVEDKRDNCDASI